MHWLSAESSVADSLQLQRGRDSLKQSTQYICKSFLYNLLHLCCFLLFLKTYLKSVFVPKVVWSVFFGSEVPSWAQRSKDKWDGSTFPTMESGYTHITHLLERRKREKRKHEKRPFRYLVIRGHHYSCSKRAILGFQWVCCILWVAIIFTDLDQFR